MVIVVPCSDCSESALSYKSIVQKVAAQDISVHVLNEFAYELTQASRNPAGNYLFGKKFSVAVTGSPASNLC